MPEGRSRQKLRTRRALTEAAVALIREGRTVTMAEAAEAADVSLATAYRYFSSPQELLQETQLLVRTPDFTADLPADPAERLDTLISRVAEFQLGDEAMWRSLVRASLERWFAQHEQHQEQGQGQGRGHEGGEPEIPTRNQTRLGYTRTALEPLADTLPPELHRRLAMAVTLVYGAEALISARDACGLDPEEARDVMRWAASALLEKAVRDAPAE
ncbi:helix-turn-helix transcriptional regulator [Streptomyces sp. MBT65]|uniref:TetR/AcrR family transcriptional regulator n=1 Tax=Streptomyces sp. MBT65 TaxID=1488395 RepID=UPI00190BE12F|nr:helix-turn-helix domain-containing protein [Streptomyces sp. MBT65]MBK3580028.1 helix-turn-helix transcriptional regulator [Streptomyces sp. MBT65]